MAETIESFVAKLQEEGVQAGRKEAERLHAEAEEQAGKIIRQARQQAEKILADATRQAEETRARSRTDLELASRDAMLRLQEALGRALSAILADEAGRLLADSDFLGKLLHEIVLKYVEADFARKEVFRINVPREMRDHLISWAIKELGEQLVQRVRPAIDLEGTLADAGFEYTIAGSTVEVTRSSVVETLMEMVGPGLRDVLARTAAEEKAPGKDQGKD
ncbi:MAG TPA: hypothetical protein VM031_04735 [Phycisphaerae bacterium]|nr:hypothetical protein [Phycisphaerae bacterium]